VSENLDVLAQLERTGRRLASWAWINVGIAVLGGLLTWASYNATASGDRYIFFKGAIGWGIISAVVNAVRYFRVQTEAHRIRSAAAQGRSRPETQATVAIPVPAGMTTSEPPLLRKTPAPSITMERRLAASSDESPADHYVEQYDCEEALFEPEDAPNLPWSFVVARARRYIDPTSMALTDEEPLGGRAARVVDRKQVPGYFVMFHNEACFVEIEDVLSEDSSSRQPFVKTFLGGDTFYPDAIDLSGLDLPELAYGDDRLRTHSPDIFLYVDSSINPIVFRYGTGNLSDEEKQTTLRTVLDIESRLWPAPG
jgi:hypothetical protein